MKFLKKLNLKPLHVLKSIGLVVLAIIILTFAFKLIGSSFSPVLERVGLSGSYRGYDKISSNQSSDGYFAEEAMDMEMSAPMGASLSYRNVSPSPYNNGSTGFDAEEFEVTEYYASIRTRSLEEDCQAISDLKPSEDVIFENANASDRSCNFTFKVAHDSVDEVLEVVKDLNPRDLSESTYTIKKRIEDYTSELDILESKLEVIDDTLANAILAYDSISNLATQTKDVESLAKIIDSKIMIIERLTTSKVNISAQIERLARAKDSQLDRLDYTYFNVSIYEDKFVDGQSLKDTWKSSIQTFIRDLNKIVQDISINLIVIILWMLQYALYVLILVAVVKYGFKVAKNIWKR